MQVKAAFHDTDTDILAREIARVGRKDVGVSGESVAVSVSWNAAFNARPTTAMTGSVLSSSSSSDY